MSAELPERVGPLFREIEKRLDRGRLIMAIDGRCASGKSTLGTLLEKRYGCTVFHMDDFFLPPSMRSTGRLAVPGENVDHERFLAEVLLPCFHGEPVLYRKYDCHADRMEPAVELPPKELTVVEGVYSLHPGLLPYYGLKVFLDAGKELQRERICRRNGPEAAQRFFQTWIPLEEAYFTAFRIRELCDIIVPAEK